MTDDEAEREIRNRLVEIAENNVGVDADQAEDRYARALRHALVAIADRKALCGTLYLTVKCFAPATEAEDAMLAARRHMKGGAR